MMSVKTILTKKDQIVTYQYNFFFFFFYQLTNISK